jgi:hypothetical protein
MADYRGAWNKTDYVQDASLPFRRLIWAVTIKDYYIIHYEKGGFGYSTHYLVAAPDRNTKKWKVLWAGVAFERGQDYPAFISALKKRKLDSNPSLGH